MQPFYRFAYLDSFHLDNVYTRIANYRFALTVGKQQISLGTGYFVNPTDVLNTKNILDPTYEQTGHNAIRGDIALANRVSLMAMYTPIAFNWHNSGKLLRLKAGIGHFDFSVLGYEFEQISTDYFTFEQTRQRRRLVGSDLVGEILGLGVWTEECYNFIEDDDNFYEFITGADYTFGSGLYIMTEYHHNSLGKSSYLDYNLNDWMRFLAGETKSIGRDQIYGLIQYSVSDLFKVGAYSVFSLSDKSVALVPMVYYSIFENVDLTIMLNLYLGKKGTEFGNLLGQAGFLRCRVYF